MARVPFPHKLDVGVFRTFYLKMNFLKLFENKNAIYKLDDPKIAYWLHKDYASRSSRGESKSAAHYLYYIINLFNKY